MKELQITGSWHWCVPHASVRSLQDGTYDSIEELSAAAELHPKIVRQSTAFLAPDITEATLLGGQAADLTIRLRALLGRTAQGVGCLRPSARASGSRSARAGKREGKNTGDVDVSARGIQFSVRSSGLF